MRPSLLALPLLASLPFGAAYAQWNPQNPVASVQKTKDGALAALKSGTLKLQVCSDSIVRVQYSPTSSFPVRPEYVVTKSTWPEAAFTFAATPKEFTVSTAQFAVTVSMADSSIVYSEPGGRRLMQEGPRRLISATVNGEETFHAETVIPVWGSSEAFYGLGQHQSGVFNFRGEWVELSQENANIAVPVFLSSNGYGVFWNNTSRSRFNNRFPQTLYLSSEVADVIDYYFIYGPDFGKIVASLRELTGPVPMFGKWALGFWQCKNRYNSQQEILDVAHKYRELRIPVDNIVQDWFWWNRKGEMVFNKNYPDPKGMIDDLHRNNFHLMMSVWPFFDRGSAEYAEMDKRGWLVERTKFGGFHPEGMAVYDATNPEARAYYWGLMNKGLFQIGADAWWLDTTEPETEGQQDNILVNHKVAAGSGARYANAYPLMTIQGVYEGQRAASNDKRVFILSRSAFAGAQRYSVAVWSGDIGYDWETLRRQIPAGLNIALSGFPYWTTDIGGFTGGDIKSPAYRELFVRWFQYGAFCPIFRVHGSRPQNELWSYGPEAQAILTSFDRLRYELLPYIYSLAWKTTNEHYTPMRPLVMDFRPDARVMNIADQFLFGPSILVSPVTEPEAVARHLYLPKAKWYDFWTGVSVEGGKAIDAPAPLDRMPLHVRAGSILPLGPDVEYAAEKPADPIELRVYRGADGDFTLYEDENDNYNYEKGARATIPMHWDDGAQKLTIGDRAGRFRGMLETRKFNIVFVDRGRGAGIGHAAKPDRTVEYSGKAITIAK